MEDDVKFIDAESWTGTNKEKLTFKEIVLSHLKKIGCFTSVEFRGGYWEIRPNPNINSNMDIKIYVPDTREVYSHSIEYLYDILYPHLDQETIKECDKIDIKLKEAYKKYTYEKEREDKDAEEGKRADRSFADINDRISYRSAKRLIMRKMFRVLSVFLKKNNYMEGKIFEETV